MEECYALVRREAVRQATLKGDLSNPDTSAMVAKQKPLQKGQDRTTNNRSGVDKSNLKCSHCTKTGHTKSRCFELVGYL